ncbi:hypothetical protein GAGA_0599 [Paraglaciecola agarilytica NO2]|uniref:Uncharacterized protein n=1 Tax=Paraglaciecola agarilytica NO2 TaxID=1125747 RepID=A0ABQ0I2E6_9ALTE|nr:hypothetical protein GAGA_0599 [Paraglaciecola agarilytica NO2]
MVARINIRGLFTIDFTSKCICLGLLFVFQNQLAKACKERLIP